MNLDTAAYSRTLYKMCRIGKCTETKAHLQGPGPGGEEWGATDDGFGVSLCDETILEPESSYG